LSNNDLQACFGVKQELQVNISETDKSVYTANWRTFWRTIDFV